jgi:circadian clock protein KaiB
VCRGSAGRKIKLRALRRGRSACRSTAPCRSFPRRTLARWHGGLLSNFILTLYVTGKTARAAVAIANLRRLCDEELVGEYELQVIDVLEHPELAEDDRILATPTLIKRLPPPLRRIIGDLSDREKVLLGLEVRSDPSGPLDREERP